MQKNSHRSRWERFLQKKLQLYRTGNLAGTQATGAGVNLLGGAVNNRLYAFDVGTPSTVCAPMRVRNLNTESNTFAAEITFSHVLHLL